MANRKQRRNTYIREKNYLREGGRGVFEIDVCREMMYDTVFVETLIKNTIRDISNKFKLRLDFEVRASEEYSDNLVKGIVTIKLSFKKRNLQN